MDEIPRTHPRYHSLIIRKKLVEAFRQGIVVPEGLIAHGRGEALDYILGEKTLEPAYRAIKAASALLLTSKNPVISVNGNTAALVPKELVELSKIVKAKLEVNLFHRTIEREIKIGEFLKSFGAEEVLGIGSDASETIPGLESKRRFVSNRGIYSADTVLVALEDGDRTEQLVRMGKKVVAIDLNPFSRTARAASITIVDNVTRALPILIEECKNLLNSKRDELKEIVTGFDNERNLKDMIREIRDRLSTLSSLEDE
ncbi:MAG: 4-phosphopantoate--beta-alanine ligase [Nitrososphaerota archaeon]